MFGSDFYGSSDVTDVAEFFDHLPTAERYYEIHDAKAVARSLPQWTRGFPNDRPSCKELIGELEIVRVRFHADLETVEEKANEISI
jgi:hypothetical protein